MTGKPAKESSQPFTEEVKKADEERTPEQNHAIEAAEQEAAAEKVKRVDRVHALAR